jgi:RHS repeat-associated protein
MIKSRSTAALLDKGFVGGTKDPTGLTHLGAREYDPATGRFISVDPIQDLTDAQQWNGYSYANNSPVTRSDPTGLISDEVAARRMTQREAKEHQEKIWGQKTNSWKKGPGSKPKSPYKCAERPGGCVAMPPRPSPIPQTYVPPTPAESKKECKAWAWVCSTGEWLKDNRNAILNGAAIVGMGACIVATAGICGAVAAGAAVVSIGYRMYDLSQTEMGAADWGKFAVGTATDIALTRIPTAKVPIRGTNKPFRGYLDIPLGKAGAKVAGANKVHLRAGQYQQAYRIDPRRATYVVAGWSIGTNHDPFTNAYAQIVD